MILDILRHTPPWVFALFAWLVWMGAKRLQPSTRGLRRVYLVPTVFIAWGLSGLAQRAAALPDAGLHWLLGAIVGVGLGLMLRQVVQVDHQRGLVMQAASVLPLLRNVAIFGSHYVLNVLAVLDPRAAGDILGWDVVVSGLSAGYFFGWAIRFALACRAAPQTDLGAPSPAGAATA